MFSHQELSCAGMRILKHFSWCPLFPSLKHLYVILGMREVVKKGLKIIIMSLISGNDLQMHILHIKQV